MNGHRWELGFRSLVAVAGLMALAGCNDLVDPREGMEFSIEVVAPDTVPLGTDAVISVLVRDTEGRLVTGLPVLWNYSEPSQPHPSFVPDTANAGESLTVSAVGMGRAFVRATLWSSASRGDPTAGVWVWSAVLGVRISADSNRRVDLLVDQDSTVRARQMGVDGFEGPEGGVEWRLEDPQDAVDGWTRGPYDGFRLVARRVGTARLIAWPTVCSGACADTVEVRVSEVPGSY